MEVNPEEREDFKRKSRNLSEKKRRDQFNVLVTELGNMITSWGSSPSSNSGRKMDKTTVLKSTISFLKKHKQQQLLAQQQQQQGSCGGDAPPSPPGKLEVVGEGNNQESKPSFLSHNEFTQIMLEAIQGFILVFGTDGKIIYVSESISSLLGYAPLQITERSVYEFIGNDGDKLLLYNTLVHSFLDRQLEIFVHFKRADGHDLELARIMGYFRPWSGFSMVFMSVVRLQSPNALQENTNLTPYDPFFRNESEFTSRYSLEWKFLFLDGRAPPIIGYLPFELLGTSGYDYYHTEDLERVSVCHEALMQTGEVTNCLHRFLTKGQQWIWLQTRYYITYHQWNSKPEFIVATHKVVNYSDVVKQVKKEGCDPNKIETTPSFIESCSSSFSGSIFGSNGARSTVGVSSKKSEDSSNLNIFASPQPIATSRKSQLDEKPPSSSSAPSSSSIIPMERIVLTPSQLEIQEELRVRHQELSQKILQQQEELKALSEQLLMSQYGLLPTTNPGAPATTTNEPTTKQEPLKCLKNKKNFEQNDSGEPSPKRALESSSAPGEEEGSSSSALELLPGPFSSVVVDESLSQVICSFAEEGAVVLGNEGSQSQT